MQLHEIDAHVEAALAESTTGKKFDLCKTYAAVKPVLKFAGTIVSLFKPKWKTVLDNFIQMMDSECPQ